MKSLDGIPINQWEGDNLKENWAEHLDKHSLKGYPNGQQTYENVLNHITHPGLQI